MRQIIALVIIITLQAFFVIPSALSQTTAAQIKPTEITSLDQLLKRVKQRQQEEAALNRQREREFLKSRDKQRALLRQAEKEFESAQRKNNPMKKITDGNQQKLLSLQKDLDSQVESLGDVYSIFHEFAGDFSTVLTESMIHSQLPERSEQLDALSSRETLPTIAEMESFWILVQEEMTESAKIHIFDAPVLSPDGKNQNQKVLRAGTFTAVSNGQFVRYIPETGELLTLSRQPREKNIAANFMQNYEQDSTEPATMIIDPTRGALLGIAANMPTVGEKIKQGGVIGYIIIAIGIIGLLYTLARLMYLLRVWLATRKQAKDVGQPNLTNPLGRIISTAKALNNSDEETLQYKLDEAILQELPRLEWGHSFIKFAAAVSPLLGLLGTVVGMIETFQAIAIFGSGDPKLMAGGISQALMTTVLGLCVAVPLLLGHNTVASFSRTIIHILDEQSAGLLAKHIESQNRAK